jgi:hypothetical protein
MHSEFFAPKTSLKICGVASLDDARALADLKVDALWNQFLAPLQTILLSRTRPHIRP